MSYSHGRDPGLWLGLSIASTLLCCLPLGIPGIIYAAKAMSAQTNHDHDTAAWNTEKARTWTLWSFGVGLAFLVVWLCIVAGNLGQTM